MISYSFINTTLDIYKKIAILEICTEIATMIWGVIKIAPIGLNEIKNISRWSIKYKMNDFFQYLSEKYIFLKDIKKREILNINYIFIILNSQVSK